MSKSSLPILTFVLLLFLAPLHGKAQSVYSNPVTDFSLPDPSLVRADDGYFYLYATEDTRNMPIVRSRDLVHWERVGTAFTEETRPSFEPRAGLWAPDINRIGDRYVLYYSMSRWGGVETCGVGVATADNPAGPFTDHGLLLRSNEIGVTNSIDPFYIENRGKKYLFWGSFHGIYRIQLTADGLGLKPGAKPVRVAGTAYEAAYIHKKDGYYYLFASVGSCCEGVNSTYHVVVGRSRKLFGPYLDREGRPMLENHHELVVRKNTRFAGPGHNSEIVTDEAGTDWMLYHAIDTQYPERKRVLVLDRVDWTDGWPSIAGNEPSMTSETPLF